MNHICETFAEQTQRIAEEIKRASNTGLGILEETLSDLTLNRIQFEHEDKFVTKKFTRKEEGNITGADWLWCIGEPGSWITFAVQAKLADIRTGRVRYLHYRKEEQYQLLIKFSRHFGFIPKYAIFSGTAMHTSLFAQSLEPLRTFPADQWSFSMISPKYIRELSRPRDKHVSRVLEFALPWSYIFCTNNQDTTKELTAVHITDNLERVYWDLENEYRQRKNQKPKNKFENIVWENPLPRKLLTKQIPMPVLYLLSHNSFRHPVPISRVNLFSSTQVKKVLDDELAKVSNSRKWKLFPQTFENIVPQIQDSGSGFLLPHP